jgi:hypothetical protein
MGCGPQRARHHVAALSHVPPHWGKRDTLSERAQRGTQECQARRAHKSISPLSPPAALFPVPARPLHATSRPAWGQLRRHRPAPGRLAHPAATPERRGVAPTPTLKPAARRVARSRPAGGACAAGSRVCALQACSGVLPPCGPQRARSLPPRGATRGVLAVRSRPPARCVTPRHAAVRIARVARSPHRWQSSRAVPPAAAAHGAVSSSAGWHPAAPRLRRGGRLHSRGTGTSQVRLR